MQLIQIRRSSVLAALTLLPFGTCLAEDEPVALRGDVNGNGKVTLAEDGKALTDHILGIETITNETLLKNADINGDDVIDVADVIALYVNIEELQQVLPSGGDKDNVIADAPRRDKED